MAQFSAYPALSVQGPTDIALQGQRLKNMRGASRLQEFQLGQAQGAAQRQGQLRGVMGAVGAEAGLGSNAQQALSLDPSMLATLSGLSKEDRAKAKEKTGQMAQMGMMILNSPPLQRGPLDAQLRQMAGESAQGIPPLDSPEYEPYLKANIAKAGQIKTYLDQVPDAEYSGEVLWDDKVGKHYQINPTTKKREYVTSPSGMDIEVGPDGTVIRTGVKRGGAGGMERKTRGDIEKKLLGAREGLSRLRGIAAKFKPEYQEIPTRLGVAWTGLKARFGQGDISSEDRKSLTEFADYRRDAISNINLYIKEITGAQMSEAEADRLRLAVPDPGEGIFGGDDPITFQAKLDSIVKDLEKATARYEHYLRQGLTDPEEMARESPLDAMRTAINEQTGERLIEIDGQWVPLK